MFLERADRPLGLRSESGWCLRLRPAPQGCPVSSASPAQPGLCPPCSRSPSSARAWPRIFLELRRLPLFRSQVLGSRGPEKVHSHPALVGHTPLMPFLDLAMAADSLSGSL